jgi:hypothetical protein
MLVSVRTKPCQGKGRLAVAWMPPKPSTLDIVRDVTLDIETIPMEIVCLESVVAEWSRTPWRDYLI